MTKKEIEKRCAAVCLNSANSRPMFVQNEALGFIDTSLRLDGSRGIAFFKNGMAINTDGAVQRIFYKDIRCVNILESFENRFADELIIFHKDSEIRISDYSLDKTELKLLIDGICESGAEAENTRSDFQTIPAFKRVISKNIAIQKTNVFQGKKGTEIRVENETEISPENSTENAEENTPKNDEIISKRTEENVAEIFHENTAENAEENTPKNDEFISEKAEGNIAENYFQNSTENTEENTPKNDELIIGKNEENIAENYSQNSAENTEENTPKNDEFISVKNEESVAEIFHENTAENAEENTPKNDEFISEKAEGNIAENYSQNSTENAEENTPKNDEFISGKTKENVSENYFQNSAENAKENTPENEVFGGEMSEEYREKISGGVFNEIPVIPQVETALKEDDNFSFEVVENNADFDENDDFDEQAELEKISAMSYEQTMSYLADAFAEINGTSESHDENSEKSRQTPERTSVVVRETTENISPVPHSDLTVEPVWGDIYIKASRSLRELCEQGRLSMEAIKAELNEKLIFSAKEFARITADESKIPKVLMPRITELRNAANNFDEYFSYGDDIGARAMFFMLFQMLSYADRIIEDPEVKERLNDFFRKFGSAGIILSMLDMRV